MSEGQLFYKVGRRYYPAHTTARHSFPCEGVWLVTYRPGHDHARLMTDRLGDVPAPLHLAAVERHRDVIARALINTEYMSAYDKASCVILALEKATREELKG